MTSLRPVKDDIKKEMDAKEERKTASGCDLS